MGLVYHKNTDKIYIGQIFLNSAIGCRDIYKEHVEFIPREQLCEASIEDLKTEVLNKISTIDNPLIKICEAALKGNKIEASSWAYIPLTKYRIREGKMFGTKDKQFKVLRLLGDRVVYQDVKSGKILEDNIDFIAQDWTGKEYKEITKLEQLFNSIKKLLDPLLGGFLVGLLIQWIRPQLGI